MSIEEEKKNLIEKHERENKQKREELEKQLEDLEKKRKELLVESGEAIVCKCGKYVEDPDAQTRKHEMCWRCWSDIQTKKRRADTENRLKGAQITNLVFKYNDEIEEIIAHKDGVSFKLSVRGNEEDAYIRLEDEWSEPCPLLIHRLGDLPRVERKLETFTMGI